MGFYVTQIPLLRPQAPAPADIYRKVVPRFCSFLQIRPRSFTGHPSPLV